MTAGDVVLLYFYVFFTQFQQERINKFCQENYMAREMKYPEGDALDGFTRHLMFDDPHKVIFCFVPKVC